jgi:hypothetical protein
MAALQPQFTVPNNYEGKPIASTYRQKRDEEEKKKGHPFWHKVGTVLGDVGRVAAEGAASMAVSSMMMGGYGYGGYGYGGYGPYGYGGVSLFSALAESPQMREASPSNRRSKLRILHRLKL